MSKLEHSAVVWHSSLTEQNNTDIERVQKTAVKIIMGNKYKDYENSLKYLKLDSLSERRKKLCLNFAKKCLRNEKSKSFFLSTKTILKIQEILKSLKLIISILKDIKDQQSLICKIC